MDTLILTPASVEAAAMSRLSVLVKTYGISSTQVMECLERWGKVLDDVKAGTK